MAKLRVFELARELNMESKALLEKVQDMDIEVKNHMSTLEEDDIERIKNTIFGRPEPEEIVEDKRIKPNVIRRRRKIVPTEPEPVEPPAAEAVSETQEEAPAEVIETPAVEAEPAENEEVVATAESESVAPVEEPAEETPAEIETETAETAEPETVEPEATETQTAAPEAEAAPQDQAPVEAAQPQPETAEKAEAAEKQDKKKPKRKVKKSMPAKVISMPEKPPEVEKPEEKAPQPAAAATAEPAKEKKPEKKKPHIAAAKEKEIEEDLDKKKGKKKITDLEKGRNVGKLKTALRRKEVIEGDALYDSKYGRTRKGRKKGKPVHETADQKTQITIPKAIKRRIKVDDTIVIADLAKRMGIKANELIKRLMNMGMMVTVNQTIDYDTASLLATEFGFEVEKAAFEEETVIRAETDEPGQMVHRPPVVTIMGHVDHGKTSLLDVIRRTKVTELEAGGITQHIGAYHVKLDSGDIVFLDTPGHEAFTAMRSRGAHVTDIVILVVAADDGVMPQTIEAIDHARAANVPIIVAINKIDKPEANPDRIKRELAEKNLVPEDWGGDTICVNVSAKQQMGIDDLLEMILLQSEVLELKANPNKLARGNIIEAEMDLGRGPVATVLIREGTLHTGEPVVCGMYYGKVRAMYNDTGEMVKEAGPSMPVQIVGLSGVPMAGDEFTTLADEKDAKQVSEHRLQKQRSKDLARTSRMSLEGLYERLMEGEVKDLNLIIKADVQGSIEALKDSLLKLSREEVQISVIHSAVGPIHESDISLAAVSNAIIIGFNVRPSAKVASLAEEENVDIRYYDVIYNAIKDVQDAMVGLMESKYVEKVLGHAEVRQVFHVPSIGTIAGCMVTSGKIQRNMPVRLIREGVVAYDGKINSLKRFKEDAKEVAQNYECGVGVENYNDIKVGDVLECYYLEEVKPTI